MLPKDLSLSQLNAFLTVVATGSMSRAAQVLDISQPTLSRQVLALEAVIGQPLFYRDVRPLVLTDVGRFIHEHIAKNLDDLEHVITLAQRFDSDVTDTLSIGFVASVLYGKLPTIISRLKASLPNLDVRLYEVSSHEQISALKSGEIDAGFGRFVSDDALIRQMFLCHEPYVVALPAHHHLSTKSVIGLNELVKEPLILYHRTLKKLGDGRAVDPVFELFSELGLSPARTQRTRDIQIALGLVAAGEGVTLVPQSLSVSRGDELIFVPINTLVNIIPMSSIYLTTLAHRVDDRLGVLTDVALSVYG